MLCLRCGNEIEDHDSQCPICVANDERGSLATDVHERTSDEPAFVFCRDCGNEYETGKPCPICALRDERRRDERADDRRLCLGCGNEIIGGGTCTICDAGRAPARRDAGRTVLCRRCGNEVDDVRNCPVCKAGRATGNKMRHDDGPQCPECHVALDNRQVDDLMVLMCPECCGSLFPPGRLETTLDKIRDSAEVVGLQDILKEFRYGRRAALRKTVRYRSCPVCQGPMARRNYADVSGIIVDTCGDHGTWVGENTFGELADFISRGGDAYAARSPLHRRRRR